MDPSLDETRELLVARAQLASRVIGVGENNKRKDKLRRRLLEYDVKGKE